MIKVVVFLLAVAFLKGIKTYSSEVGLWEGK
jgi:hypothetical protein